MKVGLLCALLLTSVACGGCGDVDSTATGNVDLSTLERSPGADVPLQEVVDTFVLGSKHTDVQRQRATERLIGSAVTWTVNVFDISKDGDRYKVTSELMSSAMAGSFGKFGVVAFVYVQKPADQQRMEKLMTGDRIKVKGVVQSINLRTALVMSPAVLVD